MLELFWLLLPVAAASGWWYGCKTAINKSKKEKIHFPEYYQGLNYLLNEQPDKAIEVFVKLVEVDSDTIETHLALGGLFRRRGEVERAIRIHQNLIARPSLNQRQRGFALLELGKDYMSAGLLDRAEGLFKELLKQNVYQAEALANLLEIYQQESEWQKAIDSAKQLSVLKDDDSAHIIAHYYCELAENEMRMRNKESAVQNLKRALDVDRSCVRASLLLADLCMWDNDYPQALKHYLRIFDQDREFIPEIMHKALQAIHRGAPAQVFQGKMKELLSIVHGEINFPGLTQYVKNVEGRSQAEYYIRRQLDKFPSLNVLKEWLDLEYDTAEKVDPRIQRLLKSIEKMLQDDVGYLCRQCGYMGKLLHWRCPSCKAWGTVKPAYAI